MSGKELEEKLRNGFGARIAATALAGLLVTAILSTYSAAYELAVMSQSIKNIDKRMDRMQMEVNHRLERHDSQFDRLNQRFQEIERERSN